MLVTVRSVSLPQIEREDGEELLDKKLSIIDKIERVWWYQYKVQYFDRLLSTPKWINPHRKICIDDIVLIEYKSKLFPGTYHLGRVRNVTLDWGQSGAN